MTYDWADGYVLLFGGYTGVPLGDTWTFENGQWQRLLTDDAPGGRYVAMMTYDFLDQYVLLFGGYNTTSGVYYSDTWSFKGGQWSGLSPDSQPSGRWRGMLAWDGADNCTVLFGGTNAAGTPLDDTWTFAGGQWTNVTRNVTGTPPATYRMAGTWDARDGYVLMYGGCTASTCPTDNTYSFAHDAWKNLASTDGKAPSARVYTQMTFDNATNSVVLFGGASTSSGPTLNDTWFFENGTWYQQSANLTVAPSVRGYEMLAWDPTGSYLLLFGGYDESSYFSDTWGLGPPILLSVEATPPVIELGFSSNITAQAFSTSQPLTYNYSDLPANCVATDNASFPCAPSASGDYQIALNVTNPKGEFNNATVLLQVNANPYVASFAASPSVVTASEPVTFRVSVQGGIAPFHYAYTGLPLGCSSANAAQFACHPSTAGTYQVQVNATDSLGFSALASTALTVNARSTVASFLASPEQTDLGVASWLNVTMANGTPPFSYSFGGLPLGCAPQDVADLKCLPGATGSFSVTVNVTDASGYLATSSADLTVDPALQVTSFLLTPNIVDVGQTVGFAVRTTGGTGTVLFGYADLPAGCVPGSGAAGHCVPTAPGSYNITVFGNDSVGGSAQGAAELTVLADPTVAALSATPNAIDAHQTFYLNSTIVGGMGPFKITYSGLPTECAATVANITCSPVSSGTLSITMSITDALGKKNTSSVATITVDSDPSVSGASTSPPSPTVGSSATFTVTPTGGSGLYTLRYVGLPPGCSSENRSSISCTPTTAGSYQVTIILRDSYGYGASGRGWFNVSSASSSGAGDLTEYLLIGAVVVVVAAVAVFLLLRRRKRVVEPYMETVE
jgi:hypothetical protein